MVFIIAFFLKIVDNNTNDIGNNDDNNHNYYDDKKSFGWKAMICKNILKIEKERGKNQKDLWENQIFFFS